jgi:AbrB family looped-hinge helix DNA binding protein
MYIYREPVYLIELIYMVILASAKVDKKFRITIPKEIRQLLNLTPDSELIFFSVAEWKERVCFRKG